MDCEVVPIPVIGLVNQLSRLPLVPKVWNATVVPSASPGAIVTRLPWAFSTFRPPLAVNAAARADVVVPLVPELKLNAVVVTVTPVIVDVVVAAVGVVVVVVVVLVVPVADMTFTLVVEIANVPVLVVTVVVPLGAVNVRVVDSVNAPATNE